MVQDVFDLLDQVIHVLSELYKIMGVFSLSHGEGLMFLVQLKVLELLVNLLVKFLCEFCIELGKCMFELKFQDVSISVVMC